MKNNTILQNKNIYWEKWNSHWRAFNHLQYAVLINVYEGNKASYRHRVEKVKSILIVFYDNCGILLGYWNIQTQQRVVSYRLVATWNLTLYAMNFLYSVILKSIGISYNSNG